MDKEREKEKINLNNKQKYNIEIPSDVKEELFITGIQKDTPESILKDIFLKYGEIKSMSIIKNKLNQENKGIGFIRFKEKKSAFHAMIDADNLICDGKKLKIKYNYKNRENKNFREIKNYKKDNDYHLNMFSYNISGGDNNKKSVKNVSPKKSNNSQKDNVDHYSNRERSRDKNKDNKEN